MKGWRGYLILVLVSVLLGAGVMFGVLHARGQRLAAAALARATADSTRIAVLVDSSRTLEAAARADSARADSALQRADQWRRTAADLGTTAQGLRAALDTATTAADSLPRLVALAAVQDSTIAAKEAEALSLRSSIADQLAAFGRLTASLAKKDSALAESNNTIEDLKRDLVKASRTQPDRGSGLQVGAGAGYCATGDPCVGLMVFKPLFRVPLT